MLAVTRSEVLNFLRGMLMLWTTAFQSYTVLTLTQALSAGFLTSHVF